MGQWKFVGSEGGVRESVLSFGSVRPTGLPPSKYRWHVSQKPVLRQLKCQFVVDISLDSVFLRLNLSLDIFPLSSPRTAPGCCVEAVRANVGT